MPYIRDAVLKAFIIWTLDSYLIYFRELLKAVEIGHSNSWPDFLKKNSGNVRKKPNNATRKKSFQ